MLADSMALHSGYGNGKLSSFTYLPGALFIVVGLLSRPDSYYKVSQVLRWRRRGTKEYLTSPSGPFSFNLIILSRSVFREKILNQPLLALSNKPEI